MFDSVFEEWQISPKIVACDWWIVGLCTAGLSIYYRISTLQLFFSFLRPFSEPENCGRGMESRDICWRIGLVCSVPTRLILSMPIPTWLILTSLKSCPLSWLFFPKRKRQTEKNTVFHRLHPLVFQSLRIFIHMDRGAALIYRQSTENTLEYFFSRDAKKWYRVLS